MVTIIQRCQSTAKPNRIGCGSDLSFPHSCGGIEGSTITTNLGSFIVQISCMSQADLLSHSMIKVNKDTTMILQNEKFQLFKY